MKRERAMRVHRQGGKPLARRCGVCAKTRCRRLPIAQEATVPQVFSLSSHDARRARSMSPRLIAAGKKRPAWTLSRGFWQQKNFHAHRLQVSSPLAKTGFSRESRAADSGARFHFSHELRQLW
jgi:hypothetical protein